MGSNGSGIRKKNSVTEGNLNGSSNPSQYMQNGKQQSIITNLRTELTNLKDEVAKLMYKEPILQNIQSTPGENLKNSHTYITATENSYPIGTNYQVPNVKMTLSRADSNSNRPRSGKKTEFLSSVQSIKNSTELNESKDSEKMVKDN